MDEPTGAAFFARMALTSLLTEAERLHQSYELNGNVDDLDDAVTTFEQAIKAGPGPDTLSAALNGLGTALWSRAERSGRIEELDQAIDSFRRARATLQDSGLRSAYAESALPAFEANLAGALRFRWRLTRSEPDLAESVVAIRSALAATPSGDTRRSNRLTNLGEALLSRYLQLGDSSALSEGVDVFEQALASSRPRSDQRAFCSANLAEGLRLRYLTSRSRDPAVLDRAIDLARGALAAIPPDRLLHPRFQSNLAVLLNTRYEVSRNPADLAEATDRAERAVAATPAGHPSRVERLSILAGIQRAQLVHAAGLIDLRRPAAQPPRTLLQRVRGRKQRRRVKQLVAATAEAVATVPDGYRRSEALLAHGAALTFQGSLGNDRTTADAALAVLRELADDQTASANHRIEAAVLAAFSMLAQGTDTAVDTAAESLRRAVELLPQAAPRRLPQSDREHQLAGFSGLAGHAAACEIALGRPERALELLETGRGILLGQALDARTEVTQLQERHPELATEFERLRFAFDRPEGAGFTAAGDASGVPLAGEDRHVLADAWDRLLASIRELAGFQDFLRPPTADGLLAAVGDAGPVVVVNTSVLRCDALVLLDGEVKLVELPGLRSAELTERADEFRSAVLRAHAVELPAEARRAANAKVQETLDWLWDVVTEPVLALLRPGPDLPRVWWIPTGPLTVLPLHAAGRADRPGVLDLVVSSYVPTVRSLAVVRRPGRPDCSLAPLIDADAWRTGRPGGLPAPLIVGVADAPGTPALPRVRDETAELGSRFPAATVLTGEQATRRRVLDALPRHRWVHFACHAVSAADGAGTGQLLLHDHQSDPLTVIDLARLRLDDAEVAYLSACGTSVPRGDLADEALHITGAFQMAGFQHVIGTLWAVGDAMARRVADGYYTALLATEPGTVQPAIALHTAVQDLRVAHPTVPALWAPFVHVGG